MLGSQSKKGRESLTGPLGQAYTEIFQSFPVTDAKSLLSKLLY
jgi:hypothetical protein